jgi:hypothetical protein
MLLTPYFLDAKRQSEVFKGEYKGWVGLYQGQLRADFPLKAYMAPTPDHILLADRVRWGKKPAEETPGGIAQPSEIGATNAPVPSTDSTNQLGAPPAIGAKPTPE